jgi:hypothetical protein
MYGGYLRRLEQSKAAWYREMGQEPPNLGFSQPVRRPVKIDTKTYTKTAILDVFAPPEPIPHDTSLSYWEVSGAGIEPVEFRESVRSLREDEVMSPVNVSQPPIGRVNRCFTPYENDVMTFEAFETARKELKKRAEHIAAEMARVNYEWTREPQPNWFMLKDSRFTVEHCRHMELLRRQIAKENAKKRKSARTARSIASAIPKSAGS